MECKTTTQAIGEAQVMLDLAQSRLFVDVDD